ncbi:MAG: helix-turn-helix domain-containing protein [Clostridia bacterium]|nr:helix-turn-helix domain-containing protein [Clostridia bacterium]
MSLNLSDDIEEKEGKNYQRVPDMLEINRFFDGSGASVLNYSEVVAALPKSVREMLTSGFEMKKFAKIFEDQSMMQTVEAYLDCGMNISMTARKLYMHRNTLMYRLKNIRKHTGLDLGSFRDAVTFKLLHYLYIIK